MLKVHLKMGRMIHREEISMTHSRAIVYLRNNSLRIAVHGQDGPQ